MEGTWPYGERATEGKYVTHAAFLASQECNRRLAQLVKQQNARITSLVAHLEKVRPTDDTGANLGPND